MLDILHLSALKMHFRMYLLIPFHRDEHCMYLVRICLAIVISAIVASVNVCVSAQISVA